MRCYTNFSTLLIFALLGCAIAEGETQNDVTTATEKPPPEGTTERITDKPNGEDRGASNRSCENVFPDPYNSTKEVEEGALKCLESEINTTGLRPDSKSGKESGTLDDFFTKYCRKVPTLKNTCLSHITSASESCSQEQLKIAKNMMETLLDFICNSNTSSDSLIVVDDCSKSITQGLKKCGNDKLSSYMHANNNQSTDDTGLSSGFHRLRNLTLDAKNYKDICSYQACAVKELKKCSNQTLASSVFDSLLKHAMNQTSCERLIAEQTTPAAKNSITTESPRSSASTSVNALFTTAFLILSLRFV